jgi:hypothetical protein
MDGSHLGADTPLQDLNLSHCGTDYLLHGASGSFHGTVCFEPGMEGSLRGTDRPFLEGDDCPFGMNRPARGILGLLEIVGVY